MSFTVYTDGASKGNPGEAAIGVVCFKQESTSLSQFIGDQESAKFTISERIGKATNNEAEYTSIIEALKNLQKEKIEAATIYMDSELVVKQLNGQYKVKSPTLKVYYEKAKLLLNKGTYSVKHVRRENNQIADYLANQAYKSK